MRINSSLFVNGVDILECVNALNILKNDFILSQNKIKELEDKNKEQDEKIKDLENQINYSPNGVGYYEALDDFNTHIEKKE